MVKNLLIVESPSKAKTLKKYLGDTFHVMSSIGHIKDLPEKDLGVDVENGFTLKYQYLTGKKKVVDEIKKHCEKMENVYLASDPDREGEAIAWHLYDEIKSKSKHIYRVLFNEITETGVVSGINNPGSINLKLVDAQKSRRVLDRLVGYMVSPLLWKPLKYGLSAGRVQTAALRLICERESAIEAFKSEEYWTVKAKLSLDGDILEAKLVKKDNKKIVIKDRRSVDEILSELKSCEFVIDKIVKKDIKKTQPLPLITSTLQQEAFKRYGFSAKKTMMLAQKLYEGVVVGAEGQLGLITYMRTDSTRISNTAVSQAKSFIVREYGEKYSRPFSSKKTSQNVQDAHEAIRPTYIDRIPLSLKDCIDSDLYKLYKLIWEFFIASQMTSALYEGLDIYIKGSPTKQEVSRGGIMAGNYIFLNSSKKLIFDGFMKILKETLPEDDFVLTGHLQEGAHLNVLSLEEKQHFTLPPSRYTFATLIKELEDKGIGRPSTYANIISTIIDRKYVVIKEKHFMPTDLGRLVSSILISNFPHIFEINFTADMERFLDEIEMGKIDWLTVLEEFYKKFFAELTAAKANFQLQLKMGMDCPVCGKELTFKYGKNGLFVACSNYPDCKFTSDFSRESTGEIKLLKNNAESTDVMCEKCGSPMVIKKVKSTEILTCSKYPECKNIINFLRDKQGHMVLIKVGEPIVDKCPECSGELLIKIGKNGIFVGCKNYPNCKYTTKLTINNEGEIRAYIVNIDELYCEKCGAKMILKRGKKGMFFACPKYPECKNTKRAVAVNNLVTVKDNVKSAGK
jgi:DNA topoisomerase-1